MKKNIVILTAGKTIIDLHDRRIGLTKHLLNLNLMRLKDVLGNHNLEIIIDTEWLQHNVDSNNDLEENYDVMSKISFNNELKLLTIIKGRLGESLKYFYNGNNEKVIKDKIQDKKYNKVIVISEQDLYTSCNPSNNSHYIYVDGYISDNIISKIDTIMSDLKLF